MPGRKAAKNARNHVFLAGKTQVGFKAGECIGRHGGALFDGNANFVFPVDIVQRCGDQPQLLRSIAIECLTHGRACGLQRCSLFIKAALQAALVVDQRQQAKVEFVELNDGLALGLVGQHQHVGAVGAEDQLGQHAGKAGAGLDQRKQRARGHIQARKCAAQQAKRLAHQPVVLMDDQRLVCRQHGGCIALCFQNPGAHVQLIGAQVQDGVVQLAAHGQWPPCSACFFNRFDAAGLLTLRCFDGERGRAFAAVNLHADMRVFQRISALCALYFCELNAFGRCRP